MLYGKSDPDPRPAGSTQPSEVSNVYALGPINLTHERPMDIPAAQSVSSGRVGSIQANPQIMNAGGNKKSGLLPLYLGRPGEFQSISRGYPTFGASQSHNEGTSKACSRGPEHAKKVHVPVSCSMLHCNRWDGAKMGSIHRFQGCASIIHNGEMKTPTRISDQRLW